MLHELTDINVDLQIDDKRRWNKRKKNAEKKLRRFVFSFRPNEVIIKDRVTRKVIASIIVELDERILDDKGNEINIYFVPESDSWVESEIGKVCLT